MIMIRNIDEASRGAPCDEEVRCGCGSLLARVVGGDVELKCRRCKRVWRVPLAAAPGGERPKARGVAVRPPRHAQGAGS